MPIPKVLIVSPFLPNQLKNGVSNQISFLLKEQLLFEASLVYLTEEEARLDHARTWPVIRRADSSTEKFLSLFSALPFGIFRMKKNLGSLAEKIREIGLDQFSVLFVVGIELGLLRSLLPFSGKWVFFQHDLNSKNIRSRIAATKSLVQRALLSFELRKQLRFERRYAPLFDANVFVSQPDAIQLSESVPTARSIAINLSVALQERPKRAPDDFTMAFTGNFAYHPNCAALEFLIDEVWPRVVSAAPGAKLRIAGVNLPETYGRRFVPNCEFLGFVEDIFQLIADVDLYVSPLLSGSGLKNKVLEAMMMSTAVLGSKVSFEGIEVRDGENAFVVPEADATVWADRIVVLVNSRVRLAVVGRAGRGVVERDFDWDSTKYQYKELFAQ